MRKTHQGIFKPKNPKKYNGNFNNIIYRSGWELTVMIYLDKHPDVIQWCSEEIQIPYKSPVDNLIHRYFPDFLVKLRTTQGTIETRMIEVKPYKETIPPIPGKKSKKTFINEIMTYGINQSKWIAAKRLC